MPANTLKNRRRLTVSAWCAGAIFRGSGQSSEASPEHQAGLSCHWRWLCSGCQGGGGEAPQLIANLSAMPCSSGTKAWAEAGSEARARWPAVGRLPPVWGFPELAGREQFMPAGGSRRQLPSWLHLLLLACKYKDVTNLVFCPLAVLPGAVASPLALQGRGDGGQPRCCRRTWAPACVAVRN